MPATNENHASIVQAHRLAEYLLSQPEAKETVAHLIYAVLGADAALLPANPGSARGQDTMAEVHAAAAELRDLQAEVA